MKKWLLICLAVLMAALCPVALAETETVEVEVHYQLDAYEDRVLTMPYNSSFSKVSGKAFSEGVRKITDGYTFTGWYFDPECTQAVNRNSKVKENTEIYAFWHAWTEDEAAMYAAFFDEYEKGLQICMGGSGYETRGYCDYYALIYEDIGDEVTPELVDTMKKLREALVPITEHPEDNIWPIWDEQMPTEAGAEDYDFTNAYDRVDFAPYIDAYLVADQSKAKGSIFVCSGGAYTARNNYCEADPTANFFRSIGYNAYVVNYRVSPYTANVDAPLDLQRAIRYVLYHAAEKGLGGTEHIATIGFSAGAFCVENQALYNYGTVMPNMIYTDYVCDDIDKVNFKVDVCMPIYGAFALPDDESSYNPDLPAFFLAFGTKDTLTGDGELEAFQSMWRKINVELHVYSDVPHAYGIGEGYEGANQMGWQIEAFLDVEFGYKPRVTDELTVWRGVTVGETTIVNN